jgi:hypothetical protein
MFFLLVNRAIDDLTRVFGRTRNSSALNLEERAR